MEDGFYVYTRFKSTGAKKVLGELDSINTLATKINRKKVNLKVAVSTPSLNSLISQIQKALNDHTFKIKVTGDVAGVFGAVSAEPRTTRRRASAPKTSSEPFIRTRYTPDWIYGSGNVYGVPATNGFNPFTSAFGSGFMPQRQGITPIGGAYFSGAEYDAEYFDENNIPNWTYGGRNRKALPPPTQLVPTGAPSYYSDQRADAFYEQGDTLGFSRFRPYNGYRERPPRFARSYGEAWVDPDRHFRVKDLDEAEWKKYKEPKETRVTNGTSSLWRFLRVAVVLKALKETTKMFKMLAENGQQIMQSSSALATTAEAFSRASGTGAGMGISSSALKGSMIGLQNSLSAFSFGKGSSDTLFYLAQLGLSYGGMVGADTVSSYESIINSALSKVNSGAMTQANARYIIQNLLGESGATQFDTMMGLGVGSFDEWRERYAVATVSEETTVNLAELNAQWETLINNIKALSLALVGGENSLTTMLTRGISTINVFTSTFTESFEGFFSENGFFSSFKKSWEDAFSYMQGIYSDLLESNPGKAIIPTPFGDIMIGGRIGKYLGNIQRKNLGIIQPLVSTGNTFGDYLPSIPNIANSLRISGAEAAQYYGMTRNVGDITVNINIDGSRSPYDTARTVMNELTFKQNMLRYGAGTF